MRYNLATKVDEDLISNILKNRGVKNPFKYINANEEDICDFLTLGEENLKKGVASLIYAINNNKRCFLIVDCDCDGYTSAALLINYLHDLFPYWVENFLDYGLHTGKQHGLKDFLQEIKQKEYSLVICPDSSSNDYDEHFELFSLGTQILVLDHHLADRISDYAITINNQLSDYTNKEMSGVGITWQFCRYMDTILNKDFANNYLDLVALGLTGDMMSLRSIETKYLITKGFKRENIKNPFIKYMIAKNEYSLNKSDYKPNDIDSACTSVGAAWFIVPFVNAITRSGTIEEKELIFSSMLNYKAMTTVPSTKRGHKPGDTETIVLQAVRTVQNVKNRQTRAEEVGMTLLEEKIHNENMIDNKAFVFLLQPNDIQAEIRGLVANKIMARYQRPCCVLTSTNKGTYEGSMRGYTKSGILSFKDICEKFPNLLYCQGHDNAAGIGIRKEDVKIFQEFLNNELKDMSTDPVYFIDYYYQQEDLSMKEDILTIARMNDFWGQDIDRSLVGITFKITNDNFKIMKNNTLKITLPNGVSLIKFKGTDEDIDNFTTQGYVLVEAICKCSENIWCGISYPQLMIEDYEIKTKLNYDF